MLSPCATTLPKEERLHLEKDISALLSSGKWGSVGCIRYCVAPSGVGFSRLMLSVPKRLFKRAVKRNLLKRRIREAYRLQKPEFAIDVLLQFTSKEVLDFAVIKADVATALEKAQRLAKKSAEKIQTAGATIANSETAEFAK